MSSKLEDEVTLEGGIKMQEVRNAAASVLLLLLPWLASPDRKMPLMGIGGLKTGDDSPHKAEEEEDESSQHLHQQEGRVISDEM